jgi:hypothetical protein
VKKNRSWVQGKARTERYWISEVKIPADAPVVLKCDGCWKQKLVVLSKAKAKAAAV